MDLSALWGKFDGVGQEIPDDLLQAICITQNLCNSAVQIPMQDNAFAVGGWSSGLHCSSNDIADLHRLDIQAQLAADDARGVEDILNQLGLRSTVPFNCFE